MIGDPDPIRDWAGSRRGSGRRERRQRRTKL